MIKLREWLIRFIHTLRLAADEDDFEAELRLHQALAEEEARRAAASAEDTARAARLRTGGIDQAMEAIRDQHSLPWLRDVGRDVRYAARTLRKTPAFTLFATATLAVGVGPTIAVFTAIDALLLKPLPVHAPQSLVFMAPPLDDSEPSSGAAEWTQATRAFPYSFYERLLESEAGLAGVSGSVVFPTALAWSDGARRVDAVFVSSEYFDMLGVRAAMGRVAHTENPASAAVISYGLWTGALGGRTDVIGRPILVGGHPFVIIGITPEGFTGVRAGVHPAVWLHISTYPAVSGFPGRLPTVDVLARLAPGVSRDQATSLASAVYWRWMQEQSTSTSIPGPTHVRILPAVQGVPSGLRESFRGLVWSLTLGCALLWSIAIASFLGLVAARLRARGREVALRMALGASGARILRQLTVESGLIACLGGILGLVLALLLTSAVPALIPAWAGVSLSVTSNALIAAVGVSVAAATLFVAIQTAQVCRRSAALQFAQGRAPAGTVSRRMSGSLVAGEVALTLPLVVGAILLGQTLYHLARVDTGFAEDRLVQVEALPLMFGYSPSQADTYYASLVQRLRELPGVAEVTVSNAGALSGAGVTLPIRTDAGPKRASLAIVGDRYFETLSIPILLGRAFGPQDRPEARGVVVVNRAFAQSLGPDIGSAVGQALRAPAGNGTWTVVGVAEATTFNDLRNATAPIVYVPESQFKSPYLLVYARTIGDSRAMVEIVREAASAVDRNVPLIDVQTITGRKREATRRQRMLAFLTGAIAWIALLLSGMGLYGMVSYSVTSRTGEIGLRTALGARSGQVTRMFMQEAVGLAAIGGVVGAGVSIVVAEKIKAELFGVAPIDFWTFASAAGILALAAALAAYIPARRATKVDPLVALRCE